jgi:hypothetical protein
MLAAAIDGDVDTMVAENADQLLDIGEMRHVFERQRVRRHQRGNHQRQGRILGTRDRYDAIQRTAANDSDTIHEAISPWRPDGRLQSCRPM